MTADEYTRWVWSRVTHNPVEHITHERIYMRPQCGAMISNRTMTYDDQPTGFAPECKRCRKIEDRREA